jgi:hypothetical protein
MTGLKMGAGDDPSEHDEDAENQTEDEASGTDGQENQSQNQPYIIRRHMSNGSAEFERPTRLNFFVHDDIAEGEERLLSDLRGSYNPRATKYDVREAVYRAALRNQEDIREEFERLGYSHDR